MSSPSTLYWFCKFIKLFLFTNWIFTNLIDRFSFDRPIIIDPTGAAVAECTEAKWRALVALFIREIPDQSLRLYVIVIESRKYCRINRSCCSSKSNGSKHVRCAFPVVDSRRFVARDARFNRNRPSAVQFQRQFLLDRRTWSHHQWIPPNPPRS